FRRRTCISPCETIGDGKWVIGNGRPRIFCARDERMATDWCLDLKRQTYSQTFRLSLSGFDHRFSHQGQLEEKNVGEKNKENQIRFLFFSPTFFSSSWP